MKVPARAQGYRTRTQPPGTFLDDGRGLRKWRCSGLRDAAHAPPRFLELAPGVRKTLLAWAADPSETKASRGLYAGGKRDTFLIRERNLP